MQNSDEEEAEAYQQFRASVSKMERYLESGEPSQELYSQDHYLRRVLDCLLCNSGEKNSAEVIRNIFARTIERSPMAPEKKVNIKLEAAGDLEKYMEKKLRAPSPVKQEKFFTCKVMEVLPADDDEEEVKIIYEEIKTKIPDKRPRV